MRMWLKNWDLLGQLGPDASHYHSSSKSTNWLERFMDVQGLSCRPITSYNFMMNSRRDQGGRSQSCFFSDPWICPSDKRPPTPARLGSAGSSRQHSPTDQGTQRKHGKWNHQRV